MKHPPKFIGPLLGTITYPHLGGMLEEDFPFPKVGYGIVPSWPSRTALHLAAVNGQTESLQTLLFYKADYEKLRLNEVDGNPTKHHKFVKSTSPSDCQPYLVSELFRFGYSKSSTRPILKVTFYLASWPKIMVLPRKLTCPLKINGWKMYSLLK